MQVENKDDDAEPMGRLPLACCECATGTAALAKVLSFPSLVPAAARGSSRFRSGRET